MEQKNNLLKGSLTKGTLLLIDKPYKWTSFDVVNKMKTLLRYQLNIEKIKAGHAGTLDPLATGLLIVCTGKMTKSLGEIQNMDKEYQGTFFLGATTPSFDLETSPDKEYPTEHISEKIIHDAAKKLTGNVEQLPPLYSAKKIHGKRAYSYARKGKSDTPIKPAIVNISRFEINRIDLPEIDFNIVCGKGTYIRSVARDFGAALDSGAYLKRLRRTRIGKYHLNDALTIGKLEDLLNKTNNKLSDFD